MKKEKNEPVSTTKGELLQDKKEYYEIFAATNGIGIRLNGSGYSLLNLNRKAIDYADLEEAKIDATIERMESAFNNYQSLLDSNRELAAALLNATERMERARGILKRNSESNWGMLDTSDLQTAINNAKNIIQ